MSVELPNRILHPNNAFRDSTDPRHSAFNLAYATDKPLMGEDGWVVSHPEKTAGFGAASVSFDWLFHIPALISLLVWERWLRPLMQAFWVVLPGIYLRKTKMLS